MFLRFGRFVERTWPLWLLLWFGTLGAVAYFAPPLDDVVQTGEFAFLPDDSPSRVAERLYAKAFPQSAQASTVAVVVRRVSGGDQLSEADLNFVDDDFDPAPEAAPADLKDRLLKIAEEHQLGSTASPTDDAEPDPPVVTFRDRHVGQFLLSPDGRATLAILELPREFLDTANKPIISEIESLLFENDEFRRQIPQGLDIALSGTAVVGRDMLVAAKDSAKATEHLTVVLVIALLILIYRAPLLALIPLMTVAVAVRLTMKLLCLMAEQGWVVLFSGIESYVTVLLYGAGVDYCLFLIARYKEEADKGIPLPTALSDAIGSVGAAIAASAGTVICGIGMMIFAEFGKFHEAGIAISFGLMIVLAASLTFTPALMQLAGRWVFWPKLPGVTPMHAASSTSGGWLQDLWDHVGAALIRRPWQIWLTSLALMLPFAVVGVWFYTDLSYGLLSDLPKTSRSVVGTSAVQEHFSAGVAGPITVLIDAPQLDFHRPKGEDSGIEAVARLTNALRGRQKELQLTDIRSVSHPLGGEEGLDTIRNPARYKVTLTRAVDRYVSHGADYAGHLTRLDLTADIDPFARDSIAHLGRLSDDLRRLWQAENQTPATISVLGPTASIRDLKHVTDRDQIRIDLLVIAGVFGILVVLLRQPGVCLYLILTVLFSYLVTLGATYLAFWMIDGADFAGLDWKVPMFLFTILIAVGEDYNIFLMTRIHEEQAQFGPVNGVIHALSKTGRIISSCGIIMAGTFLSLAAGTLKGMSQLGLALAFGVLLDTFVVRPILVPAYLVLLERGQFGWLGRFLGQSATPADAEPSVQAPSDVAATATRR
uniref:MMPL family transporter n=1 Tax=Schlesneria paludicola TaxID=360056 RepID=A0A7C2P7H9_9PLAN